jgi:hypothetical protein
MQLDCIGEYEWTLFLNPDARIDGIDLIIYFEIYQQMNILM